MSGRATGGRAIRGGARLGRGAAAGLLCAAAVVGGAGQAAAQRLGPGAAAVRPAPAEPASATSVRIDWRKELLITDLSVVEDPVRTRWPRQVGPALPAVARTAASGGEAAALRVPLPADPSAGKWTFGRLMMDMAGPNDPAVFVERWLELWESPQQVNGFVAPARPLIRQRILDPWPRLPDGRLDLKRAPFRLLAIVNRIDLRQNPSYGAGNAGEGRFVFGALDPNGNPLQFTVIFEYKLPARSLADVKRWAERWHALGALDFGADYNRALEAITDAFAGRGVAPGRPNGSSIGQIRTNEIALGSPWELREFVLDPRTGLLVQTTTKQSPDVSFNGTQALADFINDNEAAVLAGRHTVPPSWLAAADPENFVWNARGIRNPDARHSFALNTCAGCHFAETGAGFTMVKPRQSGQPAQLAGFITGTTFPDPVTGQPRSFDDMQRRIDDLRRVLTARWTELAVESPRTAVH
ncbi:MAG: hypothetical protein KatS3mg102_2601 [Planctomycetota bacterium]|nr:MAG: hypothetical protein KatS3mg102_2601 [Planctomycetota bacterium]